MIDARAAGLNWLALQDAKVLQEALQTGLIELDDKIKSEHEEYVYVVVSSC